MRSCLLCFGLLISWLTASAQPTFGEAPVNLLNGRFVPAPQIREYYLSPADTDSLHIRRITIHSARYAAREPVAVWSYNRRGNIIDEELRRPSLRFRFRRRYTRRSISVTAYRGQSQPVFQHRSVARRSRVSKGSEDTALTRTTYYYPRRRTGHHAALQQRKRVYIRYRNAVTGANRAYAEVETGLSRRGIGGTGRVLIFDSSRLPVYKIELPDYLLEDRGAAARALATITPLLSDRVLQLLNRAAYAAWKPADSQAIRALQRELQGADSAQRSLLTTIVGLVRYDTGRRLKGICVIGVDSRSGTARLYTEDSFSYDAGGNMVGWTTNRTDYWYEPPEAASRFIHDTLPVTIIRSFAYGKAGRMSAALEEYRTILTPNASNTALRAKKHLVIEYDTRGSVRSISSAHQMFQTGNTLNRRPLDMSTERWDFSYDFYDR